MIEFIFTKSTLIGSRFIRWGLAEDCSHFLVRFGDLIFHSTGVGAEFDLYERYFKKKNVTIVHRLKLNIPKHVEREVRKSIILKHLDNPYDWCGFSYFIWRGILKKFIGIRMPRINKWEKPGSNLCTSVINSIPIEFGLSEWGEDMLSPNMLYEILKQNRFIDESK